MLLKKKSLSNSSRHQLNLNKSLLSKKSIIVKYLSFGKNILCGRCSNFGKITVRSKERGAKFNFRKNIFMKINYNFSILISTFYDSKRTSFVSLFFNLVTLKFFNSLSVLNTHPGSIVSSYLTYPELCLGSLMSLINVPSGSIINSISISNKSKYIKSAGSYGTIIQRGLVFSVIKMPSGCLKKFRSLNLCVLGFVSNSLHYSTVLGKAGRSRLKGVRPSVRGVAMNPVDHPHGGQTSGGVPSLTPWGLPTKGKPTRKKKNVTL
jgi:large subunit ribosomal protein L2